VVSHASYISARATPRDIPNVKSPGGTGTVRRVKGSFAIFAILLAVLLGPAVAAAHPTITNGMEVVVHPDHVAVRAKISLAQIDIAHRIDESGSGPIDPA